LIRERKRILKRQRAVKKAEKKKLKADGTDSHKGEVARDADNNDSTTDLEQSNLSGLDLNKVGSQRAGLNYSTSSRVDEVDVLEQSQEEMCVTAPKVTINKVERHPNTRPNKRMGNAFASFRIAASQRILGGLDISDDSSSDNDDSDSDSDNSSKIEDKPKKETKPLQPDRRRKTITSALKNSLTFAKKKPSRHVHQREPKRDQSSSSSSSSESDSDSSSSDSSSKSSSEKHTNRGVNTRSISELLSSAQADSDKDNQSDDGSISICSDNDSSSHGKANKRVQKHAVKKRPDENESTAMHSVSDSHLYKTEATHKRRSSLPDAHDLSRPKDKSSTRRKSRLHEEHKSRPPAEKNKSQRRFAESDPHGKAARHHVSVHGDKMSSMHKHKSGRRLSQPELHKNLHLQELEPSKFKPALDRHKQLEKRPSQKKLSKKHRPVKPAHHRSNDCHSNHDAKPCKDSAKKPLKETSEIEPESKHHIDKAGKVENHQQLHDSVLTKAAEYLPRGLDPEAANDHATEQSVSRSNSSKSINNAIDQSSNSRMSSRPRSSQEGHEAPSSHKLSRSKSRRKHRTSKPNPPSQSTKKPHGRPALRKLKKIRSSLKSSLNSSLKGKKLSGAATNVLEADTPDDTDKREKKPSKARSTKSSHAGKVDEHTSFNVKTKSSKHTSDEDFTKKCRQRNTFL
jgi:hypothetical protein